MSNESVIKWRKNTKRLLLDLMGAKCNRCDYARCFDALEFHHIDEDKKDFSISSALMNPKALNLIMKEAKKCVLLCVICHRELHAKLWKLEEIKIVEWEIPAEKIINKYLITGRCAICGIEVSCNKICCSRGCAAKRSRKIDWPNINDLVDMLKYRSKLSVARELGVSDVAINKHLKKYCGVGG